MNQMSSQFEFRQALVLEDIPEANIWLKEMLEAVFPAIDIAQAHSLAESYNLVNKGQTYDIALIDLGLPDGNGTAVIEHIASHSPQTRILVVSIFDDDEHLFKAIQCGAHCYLLKDADPEMFKTALRQIAAGTFVLSPIFIQKIFDFVRRTTPPAKPAKNDIKLPLTCREKEVLVCIAAGLPVSETAQKLSISAHTVSGYIKEIYRKLDICSRAEAAVIAVRHGLLQRFNSMQIKDYF